MLLARYCGGRGWCRVLRSFFRGDACGAARPAAMSGKEVDDVDMGEGGAEEEKKDDSKKKEGKKKGKAGDYKDDSSDDEAPRAALDAEDIKLLQSYVSSPWRS